MNVWTPDMDAQITTLWYEGRSATQIGALVGKTRNAVIGRVHRLRLKRAMASPPPAKPKPHRRGGAAPSRIRSARLASPKPAKATVAKSPDIHLVPSETARHWTTRGYGECAFPVAGDGEHVLSCCAATGDGATYCADHRKVMYARERTRQSRSRRVIYARLPMGRNAA